MAGTVTTTVTKRGPIVAVELAAVADAADASFPDTALPKVSGRLIAFKTNPGATAPTANYDIVLDDADGLDVAQAVGANRHTSNSEYASVVLSGTAIHPVVALSDVLTQKITNNSVNSAIVVTTYYFDGVIEN